MEKEYIVKVQTPMMGWHKEETDTPILIYNEDKTIVEEFPAPKGIKNMMGGELKQYFYAHSDAKKRIVLDRLAPWQEW